MPAATESLKGRASGLTCFSNYRITSGKSGLFPRTGAVAIQLLDNPPGSTIGDVLAHELKHAKDIIAHPTLFWWTLGSSLPGRGIANLIFEARGYRAEGISVLMSPARALGSFGAKSFVFLYGEFMVAGAAAGHVFRPNPQHKITPAPALTKKH